MDNTLYKYSPITTRPKLTWPNGARIAFYIGLNIEHFEVDKPSTSIFGGTAGLVPDPLNFGWRDYGVRVGNLAWLAHGKNNSTFQSGMKLDDERKYLAEVVEKISSATGHKIKGWLGPALTETFETPRLLKELGLSYVLDWCADEQPFPLTIPVMISVPYSLELNDITLFVGKNLSGEAFYQTVVDQFDQLYKDSEKSGRVMCLALHPFIINQPFRQKYLEKALEYIARRSDVWLTTSDDIAEHYVKLGLPAG